jgi:cytochrome c oxidase subunit 2
VVTSASFSRASFGHLEARLHFGGLQIAVLVSFGVVSSLLVVLFVVAAAAAGADLPADEVRSAGYRLRKRWLALLAAAATVLIGTAILLAPYPAGAGADRTRISVVSGQFFFRLDPQRVPVGTKARMVVTSRDVNHGLGLYGPDGVLLATVQAMPGYTNELDVTLKQTGTYRLLCFEYCGLGHHAMESRLEVP